MGNSYGTGHENEKNLTVEEALDIFRQLTPEQRKQILSDIKKDE